MGTTYAAKNRARRRILSFLKRTSPIPTDDGSFVMANIFRPKETGRYPVIMSMSAYGKDLATKDLYVEEWKEMVERIPELFEGSSCYYHTWETPDPETLGAGWLCPDSC